MNAEDKMWKEFNLAEQNPSPGGGILYCLRYTREHIEAHHQHVVTALKELGIQLQDVTEGIAVVPTRELDEVERQRVMHLLEELSVQNEAIAYHGAGFGACKTIGELQNHLVSAVEGCMSRTHQDLPTAYDLVTITIPQLVRDLRVSHRQNDVLSALDLDTLEALADYARRKEDLLNRPGGVVVFGS